MEFDGKTSSGLKTVPVFLLLLCVLVDMASGRSLIIRNKRQAPDPVETQACPSIDCEDVERTLKCPAADRINSSFKINDNDCSGCRTCDPTKTANQLQ